MTTQSNMYEVLCVPRDAELPEIRAAYRRLAVQWHPDKNLSRKAEAEEKFKAIALAYEILSSPEKRREHDLMLDMPQTLQPRPNFGGFSDLYDMDRHASELFKMFFGSPDPFTRQFAGDFFGNDLFSESFGHTQRRTPGGARSSVQTFQEFVVEGGQTYIITTTRTVHPDGRREEQTVRKPYGGSAGSRPRSSTDFGAAAAGQPFAHGATSPFFPFPPDFFREPSYRSRQQQPRCTIS